MAVALKSGALAESVGVMAVGMPTENGKNAEKCGHSLRIGTAWGEVEGLWNHRLWKGRCCVASKATT